MPNVVFTYISSERKKHNTLHLVMMKQCTNLIIIFITPLNCERKERKCAFCKCQHLLYHSVGGGKKWLRFCTFLCFCNFLIKKHESRGILLGTIWNTSIFVASWFVRFTIHKAFHFPVNPWAVNTIHWNPLHFDVNWLGTGGVLVQFNGKAFIEWDSFTIGCLSLAHSACAFSKNLLHLLQSLFIFCEIVLRSIRKHSSGHYISG